MKIGDRLIGKGLPPFVIAEISGNHAGTLANAKQLLMEAKKAGAHAVKTQCYEPDTITLKCDKPDFIIQDGLWKGRTLYDLYKKAHTPFAWHKELYALAAGEGISIFSSVFDKTSVDMLEELDCPAYKIASFEIVDIPLIEYVASTGKPMIISTGLATDREVVEANEASGRRSAFLHCTSEYPGTFEDSDLGRITRLNKLLEDNIIGLSDHTKTDQAALMGIALGARILEKHLRLIGVNTEDRAFSLTPAEFSNFVETVGQAWRALMPNTKPNPSHQFRRSLYVVQDIKEGESFTEANIRSVRPGYGMAPKKLNRILGTTAKRAYRAGDRLI